MCNFRDSRQGVGASSLSFLSADSAGPGLARQIQTVWNSDGITDFFSYTLSRNKGADKTGGAQAGLGICCSNVSKANFL